MVQQPGLFFSVIGGDANQTLRHEASAAADGISPDAGGKDLAGHAGLFSTLRDMTLLAQGMLRGGPLLRQAPSRGLWFNVSTDNRRKIRLQFSGSGQERTNGDSEYWSAPLNLNVVPSPAMTLSLGPMFSANNSVLQYVETPVFGSENRYIFGLKDGIAASRAETVVFLNNDVIVHEDHDLPIVAVNVWFHVGSKNERPGRTGFAHLFEHLMFEGLKNVPEGAFDRWLEAVGGDNNGSTSNDRTNYWENAPANALEVPLFLESDRMGFLVDAMSPEFGATIEE
mgnify:CR=1 FL=1